MRIKEARGRGGRRGIALFMKNCEPPELGEPVLAIERVPGSLLSLAANSSLMLPPLLRVQVSPVFRFLYVPSGGPPVPARDDLGSFESGQPNLRVSEADVAVRARRGVGANDRADALVHEVRDDAVEVQAVVEARLGEVDEVRCRNRHLVQEDLAPASANSQG